MRYEGRVRGRTAEAIADANQKMDRCLRAGALTMGGSVEIVTLPGYLPMKNDHGHDGTYSSRTPSELVVKTEEIVEHPENLNRGGSTDMGDLSQIMPVIHPYTTAAVGIRSQYRLRGYGTMSRLWSIPAIAMAMTVIDLLHDDAQDAKAHSRVRLDLR